MMKLRVNISFIFSFIDLKTALLELMQDKPELIPDAQQIFLQMIVQMTSQA